jgi:DNA-binding Xre family transcriptional regulator
MVLSEDMMRIHVQEIAVTKGINSAKALSVQSGIPYASAHRIWNGSVTMLALDTIEKLCRLFNVQPGMILSWVDTDAPQGPSSQGDEQPARRTSLGPSKSRRETKQARAAVVGG